MKTKTNRLLAVLICLLAMTFANTAKAVTYDGEDLSVTWSMASGSSSTAVASPSAAVLSTAWSYGSAVTIDGTATGTYFEKTFTRFTRVGGEKLDNKRNQLDDSYIEFKFRPYSGLTVTPTALSFDITKIGTGDPNIWVECIQGSTTTSIAENVTIRKDSEATPSEHLSYNLTGIAAITATTGETAIRIYIGKLANNKQVGIANVVISGTVSGTPAEEVSIPTTAGSYITWDKCATNCTVENSNANVGNTNGDNKYAEFVLNNTTKQDYILTFATGSQNSNTATLDVVVRNSNGEVVLTKVAKVEDTGGWNNYYTANHYLLEDLPTGTYTLRISVKSRDNSYAGNWSKLAVYAASDITDEIPGTLTLSKGEYYRGMKTGDSDNVGWIQDKTFAIYNVNNTTAGVHQMALQIARSSYLSTDANMKVKVVDIETGDIEAEYDHTIASDASTSYTNYNMVIPGRITTGYKNVILTFTGGTSYICDYKAPTFTKNYNNVSKVNAPTITDQSVTNGASSDWYCALPAGYGATTTFSVDASNGTIVVTAKDGSDNTVTVTDNGDGTFTIPTPTYSATTTVTISLTPNDGDYAAKTTYTFDIFRIGEMSLTSVTVDGVAIDVLELINTGDAYTATYSGCYTTAPTVAAVQIDGANASVGAPSIDGSTYTYTIHGEIADTDIERDFTLVLNNVHIYSPSGDEESVNIKANEGTIESNTWSNGVYTLATTSLDSYNQFFKMNGDSYTISVPADVVVKQLIMKDCSNNYAGNNARLTAVTSTGATAYIPVNNKYYHSSEGSQHDIIINIDDHAAGTDIVLTQQKKGQPMAWIQLTTVKSNPGTAPVKTAHSVTIDHNHAVVAVTFDREISGNVNATINSGTVTAEGGASTLYFPVWDLSYSTNYTLTIAAGAAKDNYNNVTSEAIEIAVNIPAKAAVSAATYDYVVSTASEFSTAIAAVNSSNTSTSATRKTIFIKNGDYDFGSTEQRISGYNVSLIGESRDGVILHGSRTGISNPVLNIRDRSGFYLQDLTVKNDFDYGTGSFNGVAVAIYGGDKTIMKNVRMLSNQDTQVTGHRGYFEDCEIHGTVDFICGGGDNFYYHTDLVLEDRGGNCITAPSTSAAQKWGYVFEGCTISPVADATATIAGYSLGRPWQGEPRATYLNTTMNVLPLTAGWTGMNKLTTHFGEFGSKNGSGSALDLTGRTVTTDISVNAYTPVLTSGEAARFTLKNVLGGTDSWLPTDYTTVMDAPEISLTGTTISWDAVSDARCYVIFKDGEYLTNQTTTSYEDAEPGLYTVRAANEMGGLGEVSNEVRLSAVALNENVDYTPAAVAHAKVTLTRSITADKWATIVLPFAMTSDQITSAFGGNVMVAELTDASTADVLKFSTVTEMTANQPYAIKVSSSDSYSGSAIISGVTITETTPTQSLTNWSFVGTYASGNIPADSYFFSDNLLWKAADGTNTIKPFRAYFTSKVSGAREVKFVIDDAETTAIGTMKADGTMDVIADGKVYNLNGMRVANPVKGLYIVNGKKVIIK